MSACRHSARSVAPRGGVIHSYGAVQGAQDVQTLGMPEANLPSIRHGGAVAGARTMHGSLCIAPPQGQCMRCPSPGAVQSMRCGCQRWQSKGTNTGFADAEGCTSAPPFASESDGHAGARTEAGGRRPGGWRRGRGSRERTPHWPRPRGDARVPLHCPTPGAVHALPHPRGNTKARAVGNRRE